MSGAARTAFVPIARADMRHAGRDHAAGFCVFNVDCGVVIELLRRRHGLLRIGYVDIDAHHGDGVYFGFEDHPGVIFADIHEDGETLYPGTGRAEYTAGRRRGTKLNLARWPGVRGSGLSVRLGPGPGAPERFEPQSSCCSSAGPTASRATPSRTCASAPPATAGCAAQDLVQLAARLGHGRVLALGGGGYNRTNLGNAGQVVAALA